MSSKALAQAEMQELLGPRLSAYFPASKHEHPGVWVLELFRCIATAIKAGDTVAVSMACALIEDDRQLPFGKLIKSGLARALRQRHELLTASERAQVLGATVTLLNLRYAPRELEDYCRLLRKFPQGELRPALACITPCNASAERWQRYLTEFAHERAE